MTPEQHNRYLGFAHLAYGGLYCLLMLGMLAFFTVVLGSIPAGPEAPPPFIFVFMWLFFAVFYGAFTIPSLIAGYGLLKRRRWAKTMAIIAGVLGGMFFPIGTAVCVYTFWFLFSTPGKVIYDNPVYALPPQPGSWSNQVNNQSEPHYPSIRTPPDWR